MRTNSAVGSKRKLANTGFAEVSSGSTSVQFSGDLKNADNMKAALCEAGFDVQSGKVGDRDVPKLYERHVFKRSKARKETEGSTPHDEEKSANIRSTRYSRIRYFDQDDGVDPEMRAERGLAPRADSFSFSFIKEPTSFKSLMPCSNTDVLLSALDSNPQDPCSGPVRPKRTSARLKQIRATPIVPEEEQDRPFGLKNLRRENPRSHPNVGRPRKGTLGKERRNLANESKNYTSKIPRSKLGTAGSFRNVCETVVPEAEDKEYPVLPQSDAEEEASFAELDEKQTENPEEESESENDSDTPVLSRLRKKNTKVPSNPCRLRVPATCYVPKASGSTSRKQTDKRRKDSCAGSESDHEQASSDDYQPSSEEECDGKSFIPSNSKRQKSNLQSQSKLKPKASTQVKKSKRSAGRPKSFIQPSHPSSDEAIHLPKRTKTKVGLIADDPESSEDTPDLHEPSNFRVSPVKTRRSSALGSIRDLEVEKGHPRWKGKGRASNQEQTYSDRSVPIPQDLEEEWDAGDLFGEQFTAKSPLAGADFSNKQPTVDTQAFDDESVENQDLKEAIFLLKSLVTTHSKEIENMNSKIEALTETIQIYINKTPSTNGKPRRSLGPSPSGSEENVTPRADRIRILIKNLIRTLYGQKKNEKGVPEGASVAEKRNWIQTLSIAELLEEARASPGSSETPIPSTDDPSFPYPNGPGGEKANPRTLQIMWDVMQRLGVKSFRPDYAGPLGSTSNMFLFRMATVILIKLVESGEYTGVSPEDLEPKKVLSLIVTHVRGTWFRNYREQREWSQQRLEARDKRRVQQSRINGVREGRLAYVMSHQSLWPLAKVIEECCSDDETDFEDAQRVKHCKVRILPWRSAHLDSVFQSIDKARVRHNSVKLQPGNQPRIRTRSHENPISSLVPPEEIYRDCLSEAYYNELEPWEKAEIKIINRSILKTVRELIAQNLLPQPL
ncbi:hypothetical protein DFH28DRAFT_1081539 [Melampsora americana]|nr:hypothetical protein DFH28DRAFT_1081539 [Melampsora americana]